MRGLIGRWLLCLVAACTKVPALEREARLSMLVVDDAGRRLGGVPLEVDAKRVAVTDQQGRARATIEGQAVRRVFVGVQCPHGYRDPARRAVAMGASRTALELEMVCRPLERTLALVVRAPGGQGLTVRGDGEPLGQVGEDGTFHALLRRAPGSELRVVLDTGANTRLAPRNPTRSVRVLERDEILVVDQSFAAPEPRRSRRRVSPAPSVPRRIPYAIRGSSG